VATVLARAILDPESRRRTILGATEIGLITILYFALAKASLAFASINPSATPVWPPTGLALGLTLVRGYRVVPAIFVGAFTVNLTIAWHQLPPSQSPPETALRHSWAPSF
jgi:integral membrane sensor domain MASE1